jgi:hypothetical protein
MNPYPPLPEPPPRPVEAGARSTTAEPAQRSRTPLVVGLLVLLVLAGVVAGVAAWLAAPGRCDEATFTSDRFGYCVAAPPGWSAEPARVGQASVDSFLIPDGSAAVFVQAVDLQDGQTLDRFAEYVRGLGEQGGYSMGGITQTEVGGVPAMTWEVFVSSTTGATRMREVVFVRGATAWRVQFADTSGGYDAHSPAFQQMLSSWHFN